GQSGGENLVADIEVLIAEERFQGPRAVPAGAPAEDDRIVRLDDADAAPRLAGEQVAGLDVVASDGNLRLVAVADGVALVAALPLADQCQALVEIGQVQVPEGHGPEHLDVVVQVQEGGAEDGIAGGRDDGPQRLRYGGLIEVRRKDRAADVEVLEERV